MKPVNDKSLYHALAEKWEQLEKKQITVEEAEQFCNIASGMSSIANRQLKLAALQREMQSSGNKVRIRNVELKDFDTFYEEPKKIN